MMRALRCLTAWILAELWLGLTVLVTALLAFGNFIVAWQSFAAQGFEELPLRHVPFLGLFAEGFGFGDVPLAALYALVLTAATNIAVIALAKELIRMIQLYFDYRGLLRAPDPAERVMAADCLDRLLETALRLVPMLILATLVIRFDVEQFRLRYESLFNSAEVLDWAPEAVARLGQFLAGFIQTAVWGYVGCVVGVAVAMEYAFVRAAERWQVLDNAIQEFIGEEQAQGAQPEIQHAAAGVEVGSMFQGSPAGTRSDRVVTPVIGGAPEPPASPGHSPEPVSPPQVPPVPPVAVPSTAGPEVEVIVGPGETRRIPMAEIERDTERFVRDGSGRAWFLRTYYERVIGREAGREEQE